MLRTIKLSVDPVYIDPGSTLKHAGTSYQVSNTTSFATAAALVVNRINDAVNLLSYTFDHVMVPGQPLYVRTRYHFNDGSASSWSNIISLNSTQDGMKTSDTVLSTPVVATSIDYTHGVGGELLVSATDLVIITGPGTINAVSWSIESTDGTVLYELPKSTDVLSELRVPLSVLRGRSVYLASVVVHTDTNATSNPGRIVGTTTAASPTYFVAKLFGTLYHNAINAIEIINTTTTYTFYDIRITDATGNVLEEHPNIVHTNPMFTAGALLIGSFYNVEMRAHTPGGSVTPWVNIYQGTAYTYEPKQWSVSVGYRTDMMHFGGYIDFNGLSTQSLDADIGGVFYMAVPETNRLAAYRMLHGGLYPLGREHTLASATMSKIPSVTSKRMYNGGYLFDVATVAGAKDASAFIQMDYGTTGEVLIEKTSLARADERYGTGRCNSLVIGRDGLVHYIPGAIVDPATGANVPLEMRVYDINTNAIVDHIPLPAAMSSVTEQVSLCEDNNGTLYIFGGTGGVTKIGVHNQDGHTLLNKTIYKYDKVARSWTATMTLTTAAAISYRYRMMPMKNGSIFIVDVTPTITGYGNRVSYVYDPVVNSVIASVTNNPLSEHIGITVNNPDGDMLMMSSTADVVEQYGLFMTTTSTATVTNVLTSASQPVADLVVAIGDTVYVRDPYRYASITINGTSPTNTGKLVWVKDTGPITYLYNDLIVTRNMTLPPVPIGQVGPVYNKVVVVGDAVLTLL